MRIEQPLHVDPEGRAQTLERAQRCIGAAFLEFLVVAQVHPSAFGGLFLGPTPFAALAPQHLREPLGQSFGGSAYHSRALWGPCACMPRHIWRNVRHIWRVADLASASAAPINMAVPPHCKLSFPGLDRDACNDKTLAADASGSARGFR